MLTDTYARLILNQIQNISCIGEAERACQRVVLVLECIRAKNQMKSCKVLAGLWRKWMFQCHTMHFFSNMFVGRSFSDKHCQVPVKQWLSERRTRFHRPKVDILLAVVFCALGIALKKSGICHPSDGRWMFVV